MKALGAEKNLLKGRTILHCTIFSTIILGLLSHQCWLKKGKDVNSEIGTFDLSQRFVEDHNWYKIHDFLPDVILKKSKITC